MCALKVVSAVSRFCLAAALLVGLAAASDDRPSELGPPIQIGGEPRLINAGGYQYHSAVASDGIDYLVVWHDSREGSAAIRGARVSSSGLVLDATGFEIPGDKGFGSEPDVCFDGVNYFVVWQDYRGGDVDIYGARVTREGTVLDPEGLPICTAMFRQTNPALAFDGKTFLVVWEDERGDRDLYASRVCTSGVVLDPDGIAVSTAHSYQSTPTIAYDGENYLVAWSDSRLRETDGIDIYCARVSPAGNVLDPDGIAVSSAPDDQIHPDVAYQGGTYMVVWTDRRDPTYERDLYAARVDPSGALIDPEGLLLAADISGLSSSAICSDGGRYLVTWDAAREISGLRVSESGEPVGTGRFVITKGDRKRSEPAMAMGDGVCLVAWNDGRDPSFGYDIYAARVDLSDNVLDPEGVLLSISTDRQLSPDVAAGREYMVVWEEYRGSSTDVKGVLVDVEGFPRSAQSILIRPAENRPKLPKVASDGTNYMVVWYEGARGDIYGARVSRFGEVLDPDGLVVSSARGSQYSGDIASDGTNYLAVWTDNRGGWSEVENLQDVYGARVAPTGEILDPEGFPISAGPYVQHDPAVAAGRDRYLAAWVDSRDEGYSIKAARVTSSGTVIDPNGILIKQSNDMLKYPDVAFNGRSFLVVWEHYNDDDSYIYGARVDSRGAVLDPQGVVISRESGSQCHPAVTALGWDFLVVWTDGRSGSSQVYARRVNQSGVSIDDEDILVSEGTHNRWDPAVCSRSSGRMLIAYRAFVPSREFGSDRIIGAAWNAAPRVGPIPLVLRPNPSSDAARIGYEMPERMMVRLDVFDAMGRLVKELVNGYRGPGWVDETWDGRDGDGKRVPDGVYFTRLECDCGTAEAKIVLVK